MFLLRKSCEQLIKSLKWLTNAFDTLKWGDMGWKVPDIFFLVKHLEYIYLKLSDDSLSACCVLSFHMFRSTCKSTIKKKKKRKNKNNKQKQTHGDRLSSGSLSFILFAFIFSMLPGVVLVHTTQWSVRLCLGTAEVVKDIQNHSHWAIWSSPCI